jgi:hypothetical protein
MFGNRPEENAMEASFRERVESTSPRDEDSSLIWLAEQCQTNNVRLESLARHAERALDPELAAFFRRAQAASQKLASA